MPMKASKTSLRLESLDVGMGMRTGSSPYS